MPQVAGVTDAAAERVERLGAYLERVSGDELLRDAEDFARRRPWMVAGMGLLAGFAASRFLKASSERRYAVRSSTGRRGAGELGRQRSGNGEPERLRRGRVSVMPESNGGATTGLRDRPDR